MRGSRAASPWRRRRRQRRTGSHNYFFISAVFNIGAKLEDSKTGEPLIETRRVEGINCRYSAFAQPFKSKKKKGSKLLESHEDPSDTRLKKICIPFKRSQTNSSKRRPPSHKLFNSWPSKLFYSLFFSSLHLQLFFFSYFLDLREMIPSCSDKQAVWPSPTEWERLFGPHSTHHFFFFFRVIFLFFSFFCRASHKRMLNCWHDKRHPAAHRGYVKYEDYWRVLA